MADVVICQILRTQLRVLEVAIDRLELRKMAHERGIREADTELLELNELRTATQAALAAAGCDQPLGPQPPAPLDADLHMGEP